MFVSGQKTCLKLQLYKIIHFQKCMNSLQQVVAREGRPILIGGEGDSETASYSSSFIGVPHTVDCLQGIFLHIFVTFFDY